MNNPLILEETLIVRSSFGKERGRFDEKHNDRYPGI